MSGEKILFVAAGVVGVVGLWLYTRTNSEQTVAESVTTTAGDIVDSLTSSVETVISSVRGIRNNNPGNIRKSTESWQGLAGDQTDSAFFQFESMAYGVRAMAKILRNYSIKYGLDTIAQIIGRWAPPNENDTGAYTHAVAGRLNTTTTARIDTSDANTMFELVRAIIAHENGSVPALLVSDAVVWQGIELA